MGPAVITPFFDETTNTASYVVSDPVTRAAAIIDPVLDYDAASGRTAEIQIEAIGTWLAAADLTVDWILDTHVHADHLSAAHRLQQRFGGRTGIGDHIGTVQQVFAETFNLAPDFPCNGSQFDRLFHDGDSFRIGSLEVRVMHTPGHTPACVSYLVGDAIFVGDTLFMPDYGTARADFPGGDGAALYRSIQKILALPDDTRMFLCHDYKAPGRNRFEFETTVGRQRTENCHLQASPTEAAFAAFRAAKDATLSMPELILPAVQVNIRGGRLPEPEDDGTVYLKIPVNKF